MKVTVHLVPIFDTSIARDLAQRSMWREGTTLVKRISAIADERCPGQPAGGLDGAQRWKHSMIAG